MQPTHRDWRLWKCPVLVGFGSSSPAAGGAKTQKNSKKSARREIRTRNLIILRQTSSPLGCSNLTESRVLTYIEETGIYVPLALSCALPEPHADATHATLRPRWLHTPRTSPAPIPALHHRTAPPPHCRVRRIPQPTFGHQHCLCSGRRREILGIWAAASASAG